jgi:hypothetical protein
MIEPVEVFVFARDTLLQLKSDGEVAARSCISRAYYGAFLCARNYARIGDKTKDAHTVTAEWFRNSTLPGHVQISNDLKTLHKSRKEADYDLALDAHRENKWGRPAAQAVIKAAAIFSALNVHVPAPPAAIPVQPPAGSLTIG